MLIPKAFASNVEIDFRMGDKYSVFGTFPTLGTLVTLLVKNIFILAGVVLLIFLIFGGVTYILNAGKGDQEAIEKGKNAMTGALIGFFIVIASYWIVQIIQFITGQNILNSGI